MAAVAPAPLRLAFANLGMIAPAPLARVAERLYFSPRRYPVPAREREWLADAESTRIDTEAGALHVLTWAPAFPWERSRGTVLLVHGWEGRASQMGALAAPLVERGFVVVAMDAPAHGRSPGRETDLFTYARCLNTVAERHGDVRAAVAHSAGAGALYVLHGELGLPLEAAVAIAPPSDFSWVAATFARALRLTPETERRFRLRIEHRLGDDIWQRFALDNLARSFLARALVVHDAEDEEMPLFHGEAVARAWPGATLQVTNGLGHRRVLRDDGTVRDIAAFVDAQLR